VPRTADRFPGEREDEGIILYDQGPGGLAGGDPTGAGGVRYVTDRFKFLDALGVFNGRPVFVHPTRSPTATDDTSAGCSTGMWWVIASTGAVFICVDDTAEAAVWTGIATFTPTLAGQVLLSADGTTFEAVSPTVGVDGWLADEDELLLYG
jgi:hypothetical protein